MEKNAFEGSLVLEKLAEIGKLDDFYGAIDSDNFKKVKSLMTVAGIDDETIATVLRKMQEAEEEH